MKLPGQTCDCEWQEQEGGIPGGATGYSLVTECEPHRIAREEQAAAQEAIDNDPVRKFDIEAFQEALFGSAISGSFSSDAVLGEFDKLCAFVTGTKKFALMKQYLQWRQSTAIITQGDYEVVAGILLQQNINLNDF